MTARTLLWTILASLIPLALTATAQDPSTGLVVAGTAQAELGANILEEDNDESTDEIDDQTYPFLAGAGAISIPVLDALSVQADLSGEYNFTSSSEHDNLTGDLLMGGHASWRNPDVGLLGLFGGYGRGWNEDTDKQDESSLGWLGVEGQAYFGPATLYLQTAYVNGEIENTEENYNPAFLLRAVGRYFPTDDQRVELELSYTRADEVIDDSDDMWGIGWGIRYDRRLIGGLHAFASYRGASYDTTTEGEELIEHIPSIGLTFLFGAESLMANDRRGATLDQPRIAMRTTNWAQPLD